jgi:hypothetical protein
MKDLKLSDVRFIVDVISQSEGAEVHDRELVVKEVIHAISEKY